MLLSPEEHLNLFQNKISTTEHIKIDDRYYVVELEYSKEPLQMTDYLSSVDGLETLLQFVLYLIFQKTGRNKFTINVYVRSNEYDSYFTKTLNVSVQVVDPMDTEEYVDLVPESKIWDLNWNQKTGKLIKPDLKYIKRMEKI